VPLRARSAWRWSFAGGIAGAGILVFAGASHGGYEWLRALALWLPWYAGVVFFVITHLGMVDDREGAPFERLLLPNGLSSLRLGLAPLVLWPCLDVPPRPATGTVFAGLVIALALTDVLDGWLARRLGSPTRMGRMLDPLADLAFLAFLATGLLGAGFLPLPLFFLIMLRYPGTLLAVLVLYFVRGPAPLPPTFIGKAASLVTNVVLVSGAVSFLVDPGWLPRGWVDGSVRALYPVLGVNLLYLVYRMTIWKKSP